MTTHRAHGAPPRHQRTLRIHDPAEILALIRLELGAPPRDSIALVGFRDRRATVLSLRFDLLPLLRGDAAASLEEVLEVLARAGATGAAGVVVVGDGYEPVGEGRAESEGVPGALRVLAAALGSAIELPELWVVASGGARPVRIDAPRPVGPDDELTVLLGDPVPLAAEDSTLVAAQSAFAGVRRPRGSEDALVLSVRALLAAGVGASAPCRLPRPRIEETWRRAAAALREVERGRGDGDPACEMSACELVRELVLDLASTARRDALLGHLITRGQGTAAAAGEDAIELLMDPSRRPHESICAGGSRYEVLRLVEAATRPAAGAGPGDGDPRLVSGWANTAAMLAVLAWWNHRFATSAELVDAILRVRPDHSMARLVALLNEQVMPPWRDLRPD